MVGRLNGHRGQYEGMADARLDEPAKDRLDGAPADGLRFAWPLAALVALSMGLLWGSLWLGSRWLDETALETDRRIVTAQLRAGLGALTRQVGDYGWWDEAYQRLVPAVDDDWAGRNIGPYLFDVQHIDLSLVVTPDGRTLYASEQGKPEGQGTAHAFGPALAALVSRASGRSDKGVSPAAAFIRAGAEVYAVSASPILPQDDHGPLVSADATNRLVFGQRLDERLLGDLAASYAIVAPALVDRVPVDGPSVGLPGPDGSPVGYLTWQPRRPGLTLQLWTAPAMFGALGVLALLAWLSIVNMRRTTALQVAHQAAIRRSAERERVERMQHAFVATVSHELRTPLTAIGGSLALVAGGSAGVLPDKARKLIDIAHRNSERLVRLVDDILDIERLEAGLVELDLTTVDLRRLTEQSLEINQPYAARTAANLELMPGPDRPQVRADGDRLHQVLTNLIGNAVKYAPPGSLVLLAVRQTDGRARVEVTDQGPGIAAEFRHRLFQRFSRASDEGTRRASGSGLGLYIARTIIERQGGRIGVESVPGHGATFWFELPLVTADGPVAALGAPAAAAGAR